jgi:hypothetical protein
MRLYIGLTDSDWWRHLSGIPNLEDQLRIDLEAPQGQRAVQVLQGLGPYAGWR